MLWKMDIYNSEGLSPDYTVKLCFMKLESFIKFDHVARLCSMELFGVLFMKNIFG